jgi:hypothetical protein
MVPRPMKEPRHVTAAVKLDEMTGRILTILMFVLMGAPAFAQPEQKPGDTILLTIFLKHDQTKNLNEIQDIQEKQGFYKQFPPAGTEIVSWHVVMGIGQVVTLKVPASKLRDVNVSLERTAWGAFSTQYFPTYDLYPVIKGQLSNPKRAE